MATDADLNWLRSEWTQLFSSLNVAPEASQHAFDELVEHYSSPGRYYHTLAHIQQVLQTIHLLKDEARDLAAVLLAGWYHDVIYDSKAKDNEEKSAAYAMETLRRLGIAEKTVQRVVDLIVATKTHEPWPGDTDADILLDADLAILGADEEYARYSEAIRKEYAWVPIKEYCQARQAVLRSFFKTKDYAKWPIYRTAPMESLEQSARFNVATEIAALDRELRRIQLEAEWLADDWGGIFEHDFLEDHRIGTRRKFGLCICGHCRRNWDIIDPRCRGAVEAVERVADGVIPENELSRFREGVEAVNAEIQADASSRYSGIAWQVTAIRRMIQTPYDPSAFDAVELCTKAEIREVIGNPFRPVTVDSTWRTCTVLSVAQSIYDERAFERMPILADALEDAGCDNADILEHCRQPGEHVRGCWVVDLILGKS
jgi:predicted metal-dependent HD superfamily phosphohydrolase